MYQYTLQPLFMCLEVICCVPIKAFIQVPARVKVGEKVVGKAQRNMSNWKSCLAGSCKEHLAHTAAQNQLLRPSSYACVTYGLQGGRSSQAQLYLYQILSKNLCLKMPVCLQYKHGARLSACALIMEGNYFLVRSRHCAISINYLYTNKGGLALPEKKHTVSFSNMPVERQI